MSHPASTLPSMDVLTVTRSAPSIRTAVGWTLVPPVDHCPGCGTRWTISTGVLPKPMPCSCVSKYGRHDAWVCQSCPVIVAEGCADVSRWDNVHVGLGAVRYSAIIPTA